MRKTTIAILVLSALVAAGWYAYTELSVSYGITTGVQKVENESLKSQVSTVEKSKVEGEKATKRASESKSVIRQQADESKERLRESFTSSDDEPLPQYVIDELCRTYSYQDCVSVPSR
ncbi:MAG: hypothetical protein [Caudoviricetes sp.]|nr:MAG: hypothetical protein [Caudoviricetes sp.]